MENIFQRKNIFSRLTLTLKKEYLKDGLIGQYNHNLMADVFGNIHFNFHKTFKQFKVAIVFKGIKMEKLLLFLNLEIN